MGAYAPVGLLADLGSRLQNFVDVFVAVYIFWDFYPHNLMPGVRFPTKV